MAQFCSDPRISTKLSLLFHQFRRMIRSDYKALTVINSVTVFTSVCRDPHGSLQRSHGIYSGGFIGGSLPRFRELHSFESESKRIIKFNITCLIGYL